jgi:hypothetical protein
MNVRFRRRGRKLAWQHDSAALRLLGQMVGDIGVKSFDIADQSEEESPGLKGIAGKFSDEGKQPIQKVRSRVGVRHLLRLLFDEVVVLFLEMLREDRHGSGGNMKGTKCPPECLDGGDDFGVLAVSPIMEVGEGHHLDQVEESRGFFASDVVQAAIPFAANGAELFAKPPLLVFAAGIQV